MIFLAVTMGFFAESLRENIADKEKEKEYIKSFVQNMKDDTASIANVLEENKMKIEKLQDVMSFSFKNLSDPVIRKLFYKSCNFIGYYSVFKSNDATLQQLKNSGGLRLIKRKNVADSISFYDNMVKIIYAAEVYYSNTTDYGIKAVREVLDYSVTYDSSYIKNDSLSDKPLPFINNDPQKIKMLFNMVDYEIGAAKNYVTNIKQRLPFAIRLITFLEKEYNLKSD
jgi:hypothetical protein